MSGMEMLINNIMKASGVDPEKVKADIIDFGKKLNDRIASMDQSLAELKACQTKMEETIRAMTESMRDMRAGQIKVCEYLLNLTPSHPPTGNGVTKA